MWHTKAINEVEVNFRTNVQIGLNEKEVEERHKHFGENKLADTKKESIFIKFIKQFNDFMIIILIISGNDFPFSQLEKVCLETRRFSATCSCVYSFCIRAFLILSAILIVCPPSAMSLQNCCMFVYQMSFTKGEIHVKGLLHGIKLKNKFRFRYCTVNSIAV